MLVITPQVLLHLHLVLSWQCILSSLEVPISYFAVRNTGFKCSQVSPSVARILSLKASPVESCVSECGVLRMRLE